MDKTIASGIHGSNQLIEFQAGDFPEWELGLQLFDDKFADQFAFDVLDATKLIPEEEVPIRRVGRLVLDRCVDNFFAETEQVAFCTNNIVPGVDFSNNPLLQGRNFSYLDTQVKRLGGPNFTHIPINARKCLFHHFQQDGHMTMVTPRGASTMNPTPGAPPTAGRGNRQKLDFDPSPPTSTVARCGNARQPSPTTTARLVSSTSAKQNGSRATSPMPSSLSSARLREPRSA